VPVAIELVRTIYKMAQRLTLKRLNKHSKNKIPALFKIDIAIVLYKQTLN
jgi:hypothetical protein